MWGGGLCTDSLIPGRTKVWNPCDPVGGDFHLAVPDGNYEVRTDFLLCHASFQDPLALGLAMAVSHRDLAGKTGEAQWHYLRNRRPPKLHLVWLLTISQLPHLLRF